MKVVIKKAVGVLALFFGVVHGAVGVLQQGAYVTAVCGVHGNAYAHARIDFKITHPYGLSQRLYDALRSGCSCCFIGIFEQQGEFIAPKARKYGVGPGRSCEANGHFFQQVVARSVPYGIIDNFEVVNVDKGNRKLGASGATTLERIAQAIAKYGAVG